MDPTVCRSLSCYHYIFIETHCRTSCRVAPIPVGNPCQPSPCGPNSQCLNQNGRASCSCLPNYRGNPPECRSECLVSTECPMNRACMNQLCVDPCPGVCGINARCESLSHSPFCSCGPGQIGDPFVKCFDMPRKCLSSASLSVVAITGECPRVVVCGDFSGIFVI